MAISIIIYVIYELQPRISGVFGSSTSCMWFVRILYTGVPHRSFNGVPYVIYTSSTSKYDFYGCCVAYIVQVVFTDVMFGSSTRRLQWCVRMYGSASPRRRAALLSHFLLHAPAAFIHSTSLDILSADAEPLLGN